MEIRRVHQGDYEMLAGWWKSHGWNAVPLDLLPMGFIAEDEGVATAACFIYHASGVPVAYLEYFVTNPNNSPRQSYRSCDFLFDKAMEFLRLNLIKACFARLNNRGLLKMYKRHGFTEGDEIKDMIWLSQQH